MSTTTIGTGAVVLTANADKLLTGLDRATEKVGDWSSKLNARITNGLTQNPVTRALFGLPEYDAESGKYLGRVGGLLGRLQALLSNGERGHGRINRWLFGIHEHDAKTGEYLGRVGGLANKLKKLLTPKAGGLLRGFVFGAGAGLALSAFAAAGKGVEKFAERFTEVKERAQQYGGIDTDRYQRIERAQDALDRISAAFDDFVFRSAERLAPFLEKFAAAFEVISFVGSEVFDRLADWVSEFVTWIARGIDETFGWATATTSAGEQTFAVLKKVGRVFVYIGEVAGVLAVAVLKTFAAIADGAGRLFALAGFDEMAGKARKLAADVGGIAGAMEGTIGTWAVQYDAWFDRMQKRFGETKRIAKETGLALAGAFQAGSTEAYSVMAKFQAGNILTGQAPADNPVKIAKENLKELKEHKRVLWKIVGALDLGTPIRVIP